MSRALVILDEPMNGLDPMGREDIAIILRRSPRRRERAHLKSHPARPRDPVRRLHPAALGPHPALAQRGRVARCTRRAGPRRRRSAAMRRRSSRVSSSSATAERLRHQRRDRHAPRALASNRSGSSAPITTAARERRAHLRGAEARHRSSRRPSNPRCTIMNRDATDSSTPRVAPNLAHAWGGIWRLTFRRLLLPGYWLTLAIGLAGADLYVRRRAQWKFGSGTFSSGPSDSISRSLVPASRSCRRPARCATR
jgi:hypothetical protein